MGKIARGNTGPAVQRHVLNTEGGHLLFGVVADLEVDVLHCALELEEKKKGERNRKVSRLILRAWVVHPKVQVKS